MTLVKFSTLPIHTDARGSLAVCEFHALPFKPKRLYFLYDISGMRGGHAHKKEAEAFVCIAGSFRAKIHDGTRWRTYLLGKPGQCLYTAAMVWHQFESFSKGAIMLAISSTPYTGTKQYILSFEEFKKLCKKKS